ncbi:MAG: HAD family phosphatase [Nanoarchaeota archaeon]|nr:HAD family phosphatase [Nanoarchaeota archaeon]
MIKGIIFDLDGVIADTEELHSRATIEALMNHGIMVDENFYYDYWTKQGKGIADIIKEKKSDAYEEKIRQEKRREYHALLKKELKIYPGAKDKIAQLSEKYIISLCTSSRKKDAELILTLSNLKKYFSCVISKDDVKKAKPDPEGFILACKKMEITPAEAVVIEDAEKGLFAAKKAGIKCIIIPNKYTKDNDFSKADVILDNINELSKSVIDSL